MPTLTKFYSFVEALHEGVHNLQSHTIRVLLSNTAPNLSNTVKADITEISAGNGYSSGGPSLTVTSSAQSSGLYTLIVSDLNIVASGGSIGPFRYCVYYNDTPTSPADPLIGFLDMGYSITVAAGQTFTLDHDAVSGLYYAS